MPDRRVGTLSELPYWLRCCSPRKGCILRFLLLHFEWQFLDWLTSPTNQQYVITNSLPLSLYSDQLTLNLILICFCILHLFRTNF